MSFGEYIPLNYGHAISTLDDAQASVQVQTALQKRFDVNDAKIEEAIQKISSIPLLREKDKKYLGDKINGLLNTVNANLKVSKGRGLLSNSVTGEINRYITSAIDDNIKTQLKNSKNIIDFQKGVSELKEKKPDTYNDGNYAYALNKAGYENYMSGAVDKLGSLEYNPYVDYQQTTMERALKLKQLKGDQEIETLDGAGQKIKRKISGLSAQEIISYFPEMLTAQEEKQMAIDGWNELRGATPQQIEAQATSFFSQRKENVSEKITLMKAESENSFRTAEERARAKELQAIYEKDLENISEREASMDKTNPELVGYMRKKSDFMVTAASLFSGKESITYEKDETWFAKANLELDYEKHAWEKEKHAAEMKAKGLKTDGTKDTTIPTDGFIASPIANQEVGDIEGYEATKQSFNEAYNTIISNAERAYSDVQIDSKTKEAFTNELKKSNFEIKNGKIVSTVKDNKISAAAAAETAFNESGMNRYNLGYDKEISEAGEIRKHLSDALVKAEKNVGKSFDTNAFIDDFEDASSKLKRWSPSRLFDFTENAGLFGAILSPVTTPFRENEKGNLPENQVRYDIAAKIDSFIKDNGGKDKLKEKIKTNPSLLNKMKSLLDEAAASDANIVGGMDYADPTEHTQAIGKALKEANIQPYVKDKYSVNSVNEEANKTIIGSISQDLLDGSAAFDPKGIITITKVGKDGLRIKQSKGSETNSKGETIGKLPAEVIVYKGSPAYEYISQNTQLDKSFNISVTNVNSDFKVEADIKPKFYDRSNEILLGNIIGKYNDNVNDNVKSILTASNKGTPLTVFVNKEFSKAHFKKLLGDRVTEQQIENMLNRVEKDFSKYKYSLIPNKSRNSWASSFEAPTIPTQVKTLNGVQSELDSDFTYLTKNMPQLLIMLEISKYLDLNPTEIDKI